MAARKATGRCAKSPRRPRKMALRKVRELNQALIKSAEKPAKKRSTVVSDAKKAPRKTGAPKRLKKRFKVDGLGARPDYSGEQN